MAKIMTFPHMANYHVPIEFLLNSLFSNYKIQPAPPITKKTLELGSKYSPDFVCVPFKYNLGNYIEALENGANILVQIGGGCRYGYYGEIQEQILKDLGYSFEFLYFSMDDITPLNLYKTCRELGSKRSFQKFVYYFLLTFKMVRGMDEIECYIRENIGFEVEKYSFERLHKQFLKELQKITDFQSIKVVLQKYQMDFRQLEVHKPQNCLKVGLVGELYTLMEPFSNYSIEKELAKHNIAVSRFITVTFLLFEKSKRANKTLKQAGKYLKYEIGADGTDSVANSRMLAEMHYDGIIHVKPFGCTPEVNAMPMLQNIGLDYKIPILYFSFDSQTSETGVKTRLEAFNDMLIMRKQKQSISFKYTINNQNKTKTGEVTK